MKLIEHYVPDDKIIQFLTTLRKKAQAINIEHYHLASHQYPQDSDDTAFILCAVNGKATHLVTYDSDLLKVQDYHAFKICRPLKPLVT